MGTQCDAYGDVRSLISTLERGESRLHLHTGRGTCPLTGGFAAKWHRRINGYDSGPSEPGDSPSNGITILRHQTNQ
ncbi:hypothetical protein M5K25_003680 [Dendrobium thyrsiflorum]|uniref:Uncharacterized protein n=1 Tax=Dendrobium thyrsiflorum TaxID=117978 RepID=A0ABD0VS66_DENTH